MSADNCEGIGIYRQGLSSRPGAILGAVGRPFLIFRPLWCRDFLSLPSLGSRIRYKGL